MGCCIHTNFFLYGSAHYESGVVVARSRFPQSAESVLLNLFFVFLVAPFAVRWRLPIIRVVPLGWASQAGSSFVPVETGSKTPFVSLHDFVLFPPVALKLSRRLSWFGSGPRLSSDASFIEQSTRDWHPVASNVSTLFLVVLVVAAVSRDCRLLPSPLVGPSFVAFSRPS